MRRAAALAALAAVILSGCGSSRSLRQFRAQGQRICLASDRRMSAVKANPTTAGLKQFLERGSAGLEVELRRLRKLQAPGDAASVFGAALDAMSHQVTTLRDAAAALSRQEDPVLTFKALQQRLAPLETEANDAWHSLGMPVCATD